MNPYETKTEYVITNLPKPVGYWLLYGGNSGMQFAMYQKPTDEQIKNTEELLGWKWKDADSEQR
jgi:hypothetical protein